MEVVFTAPVCFELELPSLQHDRFLVGMGGRARFRNNAGDRAEIGLQPGSAAELSSDFPRRTARRPTRAVADLPGQHAGPD